MRHHCLRALLVAAVGLLAACQTQSPAPAARVTHERTFSTIGITPPLSDRKANQPASGRARLTPAVLEVALTIDDEERLVFSVDRSRLLPALEGQYLLHNPVYNDTNPGQVEYSRFIWTSPKRVFTNLSSANTSTTGQLLVSRYDAERGLISGSYVVEFSHVADPRVLTPIDAVLWHIKLQGKFDNLPLAQ